jgi:hypothetical protein
MKAERHGEVSHFGHAFPEMTQGGVEIATGWGGVLAETIPTSDTSSRAFEHQTSRSSSIVWSGVAQRNVAIAG